MLQVDGGGELPQSGVRAPIHVGIFELDPDRRLAKKRGEQIHLTPTEFDLLTVLMANAGQPIPHAKLLSSVWGAENYGKERGIPAHLHPAVTQKA